MDTQQLEKMLQRRGYRLLGNHLLAGDRYLQPFQTEKIDTMPSGSMEFTQECDKEFAVGHHHMACQCGEPVLTRSALRFPVEETAYDYTNGKYSERAIRIPLEYRQVSKGPDSETMTHCPKCQRRLGESVIEIEDAF